MPHICQTVAVQVSIQRTSLNPFSSTNELEKLVTRAQGMAERPQLDRACRYTARCHCNKQCHKCCLWILVSYPSFDMLNKMIGVFCRCPYCVSKLVFASTTRKQHHTKARTAQEQNTGKHMPLLRAVVSSMFHWYLLSPAPTVVQKRACGCCSTLSKFASTTSSSGIRSRTCMRAHVVTQVQ